MPERIVELQLPQPWPTGSKVKINVGLPLIWFVGPNGTGKTRALETLNSNGHLSGENATYISTDRLSSLRAQRVTAGTWGELYSNGLDQSRLPNWENAGRATGSIAGTLAILHRSASTRLRVESTLSELLKRHIRLEMIDGRLVPKATFSKGDDYKLLESECHGVLELIVLLTHIYDPVSKRLLIDEPEMNLHPQYQAFVLQELLRSRKAAIIATHSPSFLRIRNIEDLKGVYCFDVEMSTPVAYVGNALLDAEIASLLPRMTEHHKSYFFATRPVFVEGPHDATLIAAIFATTERSLEAAGSSLTPGYGKDDVGKYLLLSKELRKDAHFLFDLDALFDRRIHWSASDDALLKEALARAGHGQFEALRSNVERCLNDVIAAVKQSKVGGAYPNDRLRELGALLETEHSQKKLWYYAMVAIENVGEALLTLGLQDVIDRYRGFATALFKHLASVGIHVLRKGAIENHCPSYTGGIYKVEDALKARVVEEESAWLGAGRNEDEIRERYGSLYETLLCLPARRRVDIEPFLKVELAGVLHALFVAIRKGRVESEKDLNSVLGEQWKRLSGVLSMSELKVVTEGDLKGDFGGKLEIADVFGIGKRTVVFSKNTNPSDPDSIQLVK